MEIKLNIPFNQLLTAVRTLSPAQKARLKQELAKDSDKAAFIAQLLNGPVYSENEIETIEENHKSLKAWRTKS